MDPQPPLTPNPPAAPPEPTPPPAVPTPVDPPVPPATTEPSGTPPTVPQATSPEPLRPTEWFKEDMPTPKPPVYVALLRRVRADRRLLAVLIAAPILLIGGGVFGFAALQKENESAVTQTTENISANQPDVTPAQTSPEGEPAPAQTPATEPAPTTSPTTTAQKSTTPATLTPTPVPQPSQNQTHTINYTNSCYSPSMLTIKKGDTVKFVNNSSRDMWPASDDHPQHRDYSEFDANRDIAPGGTYSFTFSKTGTWGMHDHSKPSCSGTITVS